MLQSEQAFVDMLAEIRSGRCSPKGPVVQQLQGSCGTALDASDGILPTKVLSLPRTPVGIRTPVHIPTLAILRRLSGAQ